MSLIPIPAIRPFYTEADRKKLTPAAGLASFFGVPSQYLYMTEADQAGVDGYRIHQFRDIYVSIQGDEKKKGTKIKASTFKEQFEAIEVLLAGPLFRDPPSLIVVNSYPHFFSPKYGEGFLYHLACSIAAQRVKTRDTSLEFSYLGSCEVNQGNWEHPSAKEVLAWGPITDDFVNFMYVNAIKFLTAYPHYTRILLLNVKELFPALDRLGIDPEYPDFVFNVGAIAGSKEPSLKRPPKWASKKAKEQRPVDEVISI